MRVLCTPRPQANFLLLPHFDLEMGEAGGGLLSARSLHTEAAGRAWYGSPLSSLLDPPRQLNCTCCRHNYSGSILLKAVTSLLLSCLASHLASAILGLLLIYATFYLSIVFLLPFLSEVAPRVRGTLMAITLLPWRSFA